jgi:hypothetical protein
MQRSGGVILPKWPGLFRNAIRIRWILASAAVVALQLFTIPAVAQDRPLRTSDAEIVAPGTVRAQVGFDFLQDANFPLSGLSGDVFDAGAINVRMGIGKVVEVQFQGIVQEFLSIKQQGASFVPLTLSSANSTHDVGDFSLWTKILLLGETDRRPALAFRFGYEMPNSNQARGIGTNSTNIYAEAIAEKHFGRLAVFGDLGLGILTSPNALYSQNDELLYGFAFRYSVNHQINLLGEVAGRYSPRKINTALVGTESLGQGRFGVQINAGGLVWDLAAFAGLSKNDPRTGFTFGVSKEFKLFDRSKFQ